MNCIQCARLGGPLKPLPQHNDPLKSTWEVFVTIVMVIGITKGEVEEDRVKLRRRQLTKPGFFSFVCKH